MNFLMKQKNMLMQGTLLLSMVTEGNASIELFIERLGLRNKKELPDDVTIMSLWHTPSK